MNRPRSLFGEALAVAAISLAAALLVNMVRGQSGLDLGRDYFPADSLETPESDPSPENGEGSPTETGGKPQHPYTSFNLEDAQLYQPEALKADGIVFLDARSKKLFDAGHIPGSRLCHHYRQDEYLPALMPELEAADLIIIYCAGGDCEDSIQLATDLVFQHGISKEQIAIYEGGYAEWVDAGLEVTQ